MTETRTTAEDGSTDEAGEAGEIDESETVTAIRRYEARVPEGESPFECPYCGQPFRREQYRTLHVGLEHYGEITDEEYEDFQETYRSETKTLHTYRLKALIVLLAVYFGFLFVYAFVA